MTTLFTVLEQTAKEAHLNPPSKSCQSYAIWTGITLLGSHHRILEGTKSIQKLEA